MNRLLPFRPQLEQLILVASAQQVAETTQNLCSLLPPVAAPLSELDEAAELSLNNDDL